MHPPKTIPTELGRHNDYGHRKEMNMFLVLPLANKIRSIWLLESFRKDDAVNPCRKYSAAGGGGKALRSKLTTKKAFKNQRQKFGFRWKYSTHSEVILSLHLSSISEGQLLRI